MDNGSRKRSPVLEYALRTRQVHVLIAHGKGDSVEADEIRDEMDEPWYAMTDVEQVRMRGLSADLYALGDPSLRPPLTDVQQIQAWREEARRFVTDFHSGNLDAALSFLRKPAPASLPAHWIPFLQALCWEKLGDPETAAIFRQAAEKHDASTFELAAAP
jgi:hypothetical protein